jgi:hypothetical protein
MLKHRFENEVSIAAEENHGQSFALFEIKNNCSKEAHLRERFGKDTLNNLIKVLLIIGLTHNISWIFSLFSKIDWCLSELFEETVFMEIVYLNRRFHLSTDGYLRSSRFQN